MPGRFFTETFLRDIGTTSYITELKSKMSKFKVTPASHHAIRLIYRPKNLTTCTHCFVRDGRVKLPLRPPYKGPYRTVTRTEKHFTVDNNGKSDIVQIEQIKPAFYEPHFSLFTAMPDVNNNSDARATAAPGDTSSRLVETSQAPTMHHPFGSGGAFPTAFSGIPMRSLAQ